MFSELNQGFYNTAEDSWHATRNSPPVHSSFSKHPSSSSNLFFGILQLFLKSFQVDIWKNWTYPCNLDSVFAHRKMEIPNDSGAESSSSKRNSSTSLREAWPLIKELSNFCERLPDLLHFCRWAKEIDPFLNDLLLGQLSVTSPTRKLELSALAIWCHLSIKQTKHIFEVSRFLLILWVLQNRWLTREK